MTEQASLPLSRRSFLASATACCAAAHPLFTPMSFAAAPGDNRLVVIVLRGAMDGLGVVQPYGDRDFKALRGALALSPDAGLHDLDGFFGLHGGLKDLLPLWAAGELAFAHAVSTPYRDKRSHFDGQDLLENGGGDPGGALTTARDGWLNRALGAIPGARAQFAVSVGATDMLLLEGERPAASWAPTAEFSLGGDQRELLEILYARDPLFLDAARNAMALDAVSGGPNRKGGLSATGLADFAAKMLNGDSRIAAFSIGGWDTHQAQATALNAPLRNLADALLTLRRKLGANWGRTAVIAVTEFGRTARINGSNGTDHGTGGAAILAGGAIRGGKVFGRWPGLGERDLYQNRDLTPTTDLRRYPAELLAGLFGVGDAALERTIFPGIALESRLGVLS